MLKSNSTSLVCAVAVALPIALASVAVTWFSVSEAFGRTPWSYGPAQNLAEAAALGSASDVLRRVRAGEDANAVVTVRAHVISSSVSRVTGLEAAVWHRSAALMELLDRSGAIRDENSRRHLACLASDLRVDEVVTYLSPAGPPPCVPDEALNHVVDRSKP